MLPEREGWLPPTTTRCAAGWSGGGGVTGRHRTLLALGVCRSFSFVPCTVVYHTERVKEPPSPVAWLVTLETPPCGQLFPTFKFHNIYVGKERLGPASLHALRTIFRLPIDSGLVGQR